jgi:2-polyprenyl-6-methoxyphenol hydroxylase-like FAD-dependent oxidoreductase
VLTLPQAAIERLAELDADALGAELTRRFDGRLGAMQVLDQAHVYPLAMTWSHHFAADSAALVGDAAVGMHPVTAHGFNLGLAGAARLGALIAEASARRRDIASPLLLRRYEAATRVQCRPLYEATAMLVGLYTAENPAARAARHVTLRAAARLPFLRHGVSRLLLQS